MTGQRRPAAPLPRARPATSGTQPHDTPIPRKAQIGAAADLAGLTRQRAAHALGQASAALSAGNVIAAWRWATWAALCLDRAGELQAGEGEP